MQPYVGALFKGEEVAPVESLSRSGWFMSAYCPIIDKNGICMGYAVAETSLAFLSDYMQGFLLRVLFIMTSFFIKINLRGIININRRRQWHPTPVLLPRKSHGRRSLVLQSLGSL